MKLSGVEFFPREQALIKLAYELARFKTFVYTNLHAKQIHSIC